MRKIRVLGLAVVAIIIVAAPTAFGVETERIRAILSDRYILGDPPTLKFDTHSESTEIAKLFIPATFKAGGDVSKKSVQTEWIVTETTYTGYKCSPSGKTLTEEDLIDKLHDLSAKDSFVSIFNMNCKRGLQTCPSKIVISFFYDRRRGRPDYTLGTRF